MRFLFIIFLSTLLFQCTTNVKREGDSNANDTIQTASGLRYFYLTQGSGRKVENGSIVKTKLSLQVNNSVVWNSYSDKDSIFSFVVGNSQVIKGFEEMALLMREGDNVVAILPGSLAYGESGSGDVIPPNATLVYDRYEMVSVSEPKEMLTDTLYSAYKTGGTASVLSVYNSLKNSESGNSYHMQFEFFGPFMDMLLGEDQFESVEELAKEFHSISEERSDQQLFGYFMIISAEQQEKYNSAIETVHSFLADDPEDPWLLNKLEELTQKVESKK